MKATLLLILASNGFVCAQAPEEKNGPPPAPPVAPAMKVLDTNGDGELSESEIANASEALALLDTDENGRLSKEETRPKPPEKEEGEGEGEERRRPARDRGEDEESPVHPVMDALDQNDDGTISKREVGRASKSLIELDLDESGALEKEELAPEEISDEDRKNSENQGQNRGPRPPHPPRR